MVLVFRLFTQYLRGFFF